MSSLDVGGDVATRLEMYMLAYIFGTKNHDDCFNFPNDGYPVLCPKPLLN